MAIAVGHTAAVDDQHVIEQAAVAVGRGLQLLDELGELLDVERVQPRIGGEHLRLVAVVRHFVVTRGDADFRIGPAAGLAAHHEREDPREIRLIGDHHQVEHQRRVLGVRVGHARGRVDGYVDLVLRLGLLDAALDFTDAVQILAEPDAVALAELAVHLVGIFRDGVENAAVFLLAREALGLRAGASEQSLKNDARVDLGRQGRGRVRPGERALIRAAVTAGAGADVAGEVLDRHLERWKPSVAADLLGDDLVDRRAAAHILAFRALGDGPAEPRRDARRMVGGEAASDPLEIADHDDVVAARFHRLQRRRELETAAHRRRDPRLRRDPVRHVARAEAQRRTGRRLLQRGQRRHHRVQERQRERDPEASQEGSTGQRPLRNEHDRDTPYDARDPLSGTPFSAAARCPRAA